MRFVRDFTGLALAQGKPAVPGVALTNPIWDKTRLANWEFSYPLELVICL